MGSERDRESTMSADPAYAAPDPVRSGSNRGAIVAAAIGAVVLGLLVILALGVLLGDDGSDIAATVSAPAPAELSVFDLDIGDCFDDPSSFDEVQAVAAMSCALPHDNEVFANLTVPSGSFPGLQEMREIADEICLPHFDAYVGLAWAESILDYGWLYPTAASWRDGDRIVTCFLFDGDLDKLTGSMRNRSI